MPDMDEVSEAGGEGDEDGLLPAPAQLHHIPLQLVVAQFPNKHSVRLIAFAWLLSNTRYKVDMKISLKLKCLTRTIQKI